MTEPNFVFSKIYLNKIECRGETIRFNYKLIGTSLSNDFIISKNMSDKEKLFFISVIRFYTQHKNDLTLYICYKSKYFERSTRETNVGFIVLAKKTSKNVCVCVKEQYYDKRYEILDNFVKFKSRIEDKYLNLSTIDRLEKYEQLLHDAHWKVVEENWRLWC